MRLGQNPKSWKLATVSQVEVDNRMREWMVNEHDSFDKFSTIINRMIPKHIPTAYLEGYQSLLACTEYLSWPQRPRCIFTSNSYSGNDVFKAWAAGKTEHGVPLVIGQHGGHVGATLWASHYDHQINIADKWLSWGWSDEKAPNIIPVGNLKVIDSTLDYDPNGYALMVEPNFPRYSYHMYAVPVAGQWLSHLDDQFRFISALPMHIRKQVMVRFYSHDYGWCQKERWTDRFPDIELDEGQQPINNLLNNCRISISTYNSTTILESLVFNIPTILFWNPNHWELRDAAVPYFELLKSVNILHERPESAANHMVTVWDNVAGWWNSDKVQNTRRKFCKQYSNIEDEPLNRLETVIKDISHK
jgi:putative transferase (TIGR04331 family)